jgi:hypothetical protein
LFGGVAAATPPNNDVISVTSALTSDGVYLP